MADKIGGCYTIAFSSILWGIICISTPILTHTAYKILGQNLAFLTILILRIIFGMSQGIYYPSLSSLLSNRVLEHNKGFSFAFVSSGSQFGTLLCGFLGSILLSKTSWEFVFILFGSFGVLFGIFILKMRQNENEYEILDPDKVENSKKCS